MKDMVPVKILMMMTMMMMAQYTRTNLSDTKTSTLVHYQHEISPELRAPSCIFTLCSFQVVVKQNSLKSLQKLVRNVKFL
jgi:hypothetical protein